MWAQVSMTPFSQYKGWVGEGGNPQCTSHQWSTCSSGLKASINHGLMHVADIMPTLLEIAAPAILRHYEGTQTASAHG